VVFYLLGVDLTDEHHLIYIIYLGANHTWANMIYYLPSVNISWRTSCNVYNLLHCLNANPTIIKEIPSTYPVGTSCNILTLRNLVSFILPGENIRLVTRCLSTISNTHRNVLKQKADAQHEHFRYDQTQLQFFYNDFKHDCNRCRLSIRHN
jgi:hypothetical protein